MDDQTLKALQIAADTLADRDGAWREQRCVRPPVGCGGPAERFHDELSAREYTISGLCQRCQDAIFTEEEDLPDIYGENR